MYLSKIELHGFKSFAGRTQLQFDPGITAVVGPNGCGKSNIVDAVRWVIGEQRARVLRSEKMENVIFNGTAKRRPLGMSEVKLTIENTRGVLPVEYSEVVIGRRLYRSGESEYLLNGVQCRLKDITDLFMDTGMGAGAYSVIELKMIEEILSDNAQDRRRLFEEAAGITKYKLRRAQTMRKLDSTQVDLTRLRDLVEEIEKRVRSLKRQANKAARYRELEEELRTLELTLAWLEYSRLEQQRSALDDEIKNLHDDLEGQNAQQGKQEAELESLRKTQIEREERLLESESELQRHVDAVRRIEGELRLLGQRLDVCRRDRARNTSERAEALDRAKTLESELDDLRERLAAAKPELEARTAELEKAREERDRTRDAAESVRVQVQEIREKVGKVSEELATRQRQLDRLESRNELLEQDRNACVAQIEGLQSSVVDVKAELESAHEAVEVAQKAVDIARRELQKAEERKEALETDRGRTTEALRRVEKQREAAAAEVQLLSSLVTSYDDFSEAVQYLAEQQNDNGGDLMTVADVVGCDAADR
ncbi:MAG: AAA family ATPase, partial [Rhodothermia bacterium]|nr:AAA family ATPase [Rhodothermia bacterium]